MVAQIPYVRVRFLQDHSSWSIGANQTPKEHIFGKGREFSALEFENGYQIALKERVYPIPSGVVEVIEEAPGSESPKSNTLPITAIVLGIAALSLLYLAIKPSK